MKLLGLIIIVCVLVALVQPHKEVVQVDRVIDGDTLILKDGRKVRLLQINAPERGQCGYEAATKRLSQLAQGEIEIESDPMFGDTDKYGRLLRYVHDDVNVNVVLEQEDLVDPMFYEGKQGKYAHLMTGTGSCAT